MPPPTRGQQTPSSFPALVSFSENITTIPSSEAQDTNDAWYTKQELKAIRRHASLVVHAMRRSGKASEEIDLGCTYGLSHHVHKDITRVRKAGALSVVLDEQSSQREASKTVDHDLIADIYFQVTNRNQMAAAQRGKELAQEVQTFKACRGRNLLPPQSTKLDALRIQCKHQR